MHVRRCAIYVYLVQVRYRSVYTIKSLYLGVWGNPTLNIACKEKVFNLSKLIKKMRSDEVPNLWLRLYYLKFNFQSTLAGVLYLGSVGVSSYYDWVGMHDPVKTEITRYCIKNTIKGMSEQPKGTYILNIDRTTVSTKGGNAYVEGGLDNTVHASVYANSNRLGNVFHIQGRGPAIISLRKYSTSSGKSKNVLDRLNSLNKYSKDYPNKIIDRKLYSNFILSKELYIMAYKKLRSNPGMMTPGINPTTLDGISDERLNALIESLSNGSFKFSPARRIEIPKSNGGLRPLSLGSPMDKLVQEVMRMVLEAIYEPLFSDYSHGFRKNRSCHTALRHIFTKFKGCTW